MRGVTGRIRRYVAALRFARRLRAIRPGIAPEAAVEVARGELDFGDSIAANQKPEEILGLLEILRREPPRTVVEIGFDNGGTLFLWACVAADDALLVSLDLKRLHGRLGALSPFMLIRRSFAAGRQRIELLGEANSHDGATLARLRRLLDGRPVDFLFVDGDHAYEGVRRDFELYAPLVRPGGLIAFHDVSPVTTPDTEGTARFWRELKARHETEELVAGGEPGYGIGVVHVAAQA